MEKRKSQCEHRQPMEQTKSLFCMCDSGVTRWRMNLMFKANARASELGSCESNFV